MKKIKILLLLLSPFLIMFIVNATSPASSAKYSEEQCSRYCHNVHCPHFEKHYQSWKDDYPIVQDLKTLYFGNISLLKLNGLGLSYKAINLLVYVLGVPLILGVLIWGAFKPKTS